MTSGLAAILERIRTQPQNDVLLDRFLLLVADMEDSEEKVTVLLEFVSAIRGEHPKFALQILRQVYRQVNCPWVRRPQELAMQSLQVLHDTMLSMGRNARAGLIANEMQRLREHPLPPVNQRSDDPLPPPQKFVDPFQEPAPRRKRKPKEKSARARHHEKAAKYVPPQPAGEVTSSLGIFEMPQDPPVNLPTPIGPDVPIIPIVAQGEESEALLLKDVRKLFRMFDAYIKEEPVEKKEELAPPVFEMEPPPVKKDAPAASLVERLFGASVQASENVNDPLIPHLLQLAKKQQWKLVAKDAKRLAALLREKDSPLWLVSLWFMIGAAQVQQLFRNEGAGDELDNVWSECVAFLTEGKQFRRALIFLRVSLDAESSLFCANIAFQYLPQIWDELHLRGFYWQADEGVPALIKKLARREQPTCQSLIVA